MSSTGRDGILELLEQADSVDEFLQQFDDYQTKQEVFTALEGEGRVYKVENDHEFSELDSFFIGVGVKLYEYLHQEPPEKRPQIA